MKEKIIIKKLAEHYVKMLGFNKDQHLRNMCLTIVEKIDEYPESKLNRWLGYIQKGVVDLKLTTVARENRFIEDIIADNEENNNKWQFVVLFKSDDVDLPTNIDYIMDNIIHLVAYEELPTVYSLSHLFNELVKDEEFGMSAEFVKTLVVEIINYDEFVMRYGELEIGE